MKFRFLIAALLLGGSVAMAQAPVAKDKLVRENVAFADKQLRFAFTEIATALAEAGKTPQQLPVPRTVTPDGKLKMVSAGDWTSGFFPGVLWYMYELTGENPWKEEAIKYTNYLEGQKTNKGTHDIGFMMYCSFGNGLRLANVPGYRDILLESARSLCTRFNPKTGAILSWNPTKVWQYPVIIDNMMNLELLFWASRATGDDTFRDIAVTHANTTMKNHFRPDYSSYHVVDYDVAGDGKAVQFHTHQGYAHETAWARGQAWGLYGYTVCYRETGDPKYLEQAENIANFIFTDENMPKDLVPFWDYDAPNIPNEPRDVSAAAITASALYEMSTMSPDKGAQYKKWADKIVNSISKHYRSKLYDNRGFLTFASTGHWPNKYEINAPINYADYYYIEALVRRERLAEGKPVVPDLVR